MKTATRVSWVHQNDLHVAFFGTPMKAEMCARIHRMDEGWKWEVVERQGRFNVAKSKYEPALLRCGFSRTREGAMRASVDWMDSTYAAFGEMG